MPETNFKDTLTEAEKEKGNTNHNNKFLVPCITTKDTFESLQYYLEELPFDLNFSNVNFCISQPKNIWAIIVELDAIKHEDLETLQQCEQIKNIPIIVCADKKIKPYDYENLEQLIQAGKEESEIIEALLCAIYYHGYQLGINISYDYSILAVDDNSINLEIMCYLLEISGYNVSSTDTSHNIVEKVLTEKPDVVLMDLSMPEVDGFEATQRIKNNPVTSRTVVIACSAFDDNEIKAKAMSSGCEGYITKPIEPDSLIQQIQKGCLISKLQHLANNPLQEKKLCE